MQQAATVQPDGELERVASTPGLPPAGRRRWMTLAALGGFAVLVFVVTRADVRALRETLQGIAAELLVLPALATVASYLTMARSYQGIAAVAGWHLTFFETLRITLVANTANYLLSTAGLSGFALRMYLFMRRGIPAGSAILISLVQTLLTNLALLGFVVGGFFLLLLSPEAIGRDLVLAGTLLVAFGTLVGAALVVMVRADLRRRTLFVVGDVLDRLLRRLAPHHKPRRLILLRFHRNLDVGFGFLLARSHAMVGPTVYIVLDWICTLLVLYTAFVAIGHPVAVSHVIAGFAVGMLCSIASLVPAGLGILEGSMAAVFAGFGVPLEQALVAVLIFRAAYYGLPLTAGVMLARATLRHPR